LALLDIFAVFFMLLGSYLFVEKCHIRSGVAIALGALSKLTAILIIPAIAFYAILLGATTSRAKSSARALSIKLTLWIIAMIITFFPLLFLLDRIYEASQIITYEKLANPFEHVSWMVDIHTSRNWPIRTEIPPWLWLVKLPNYYLGSESLAQINFLEALNPAIMGLALVSFPYTLIALLKSRTRIAVFSSLWLITTYLSWIPVYFLFSRPLFPFYLIAAIPSICMLNCFFFREVPKALIFYTACSITFFLLFQYPWRLLF
jgi:predicted membrane-bound dolichyl-phosphate-mannose-protein mannosyltransferase